METVDVLIVGAGLSGIGAAVHLTRECPALSYAIVEARPRVGGTWDLFRYPGIRSDSDMHTLGYVFKPWTQAKAIADGPSILEYVEETADEYGVREHIRFEHKVVHADWRPERAMWVVTVETPQGEREIACRFLFANAGYYDYEQGYQPDFPDVEKFQGRFVHPQHWPEDLDHAGKRVVVIGSGATAVTLVPEMAKTAAHVTMLQRSPTYIVSRPAEDRIANLLRRYLPEKLAYRITRWKNRRPRQLVLQAGARQAGEGEGEAPRDGAQGARTAFRRRDAPDAALQSLGPAALPDPGFRPVARAERGFGGNRHRPYRTLHPEAVSS